MSSEISVNFKFDKITRTYSPGDNVNVTMQISAIKPVKYKEVLLYACGLRTINRNGHDLVSNKCLRPILKIQYGKK